MIIDKHISRLEELINRYVIFDDLQGLIFKELVTIIKKQQKQIDSLNGLICHAHAAQQIKEQENLAKNL